MSDKKMYLVHKPSGEEVMLARKSGVGWVVPFHGLEVAKDLNDFFDKLEKDPSTQDMIELKVE